MGNNGLLQKLREMTAWLLGEDWGGTAMKNDRKELKEDIDTLDAFFAPYEAGERAAFAVLTNGPDAGMAFRGDPELVLTAISDAICTMLIDMSDGDRAEAMDDAQNFCGFLLDCLDRRTHPDFQGDGGEDGEEDPDAPD